jgi:predicted transposase/invertase (TIGR01784 family)
MKFADPKYDITFKKIFGDEKHKEVLISFLNSVLDFKDDKIIVDITLDNPYQLPNIEELKETILDIKATNKNKDTFIVEMQKKDGSDFAKRSLYYTSKAYVNQIKTAVDYDKLKKVYYIAIVDFNIFDNINFISRHLIINQETTKQDLKDMEFTFVELKKFNLPLSQCDSIIKKWIYFINNASSLELIPKELEDLPAFKTAFETANTFTWNKKELEYYDRVGLRKADDIGALKKAKRKAKEEGMKKGKMKEKLEIAKNSISQGLDDKTISLITNLDIETIQSLR